MRKIVHIDTGMELRGGQRQLLLLARALRTQGWQQLLVGPQGSRLQAEAAKEQFETLALPTSKIARLRALLYLRSRLTADAFDIVHAHDGRGQTLAWLASIGTPARRVAHRRVTFLPSAFAGGRFLHGWKYRRTCDAVIAVSQYVKQILERCGVPPAMIEVIPDGIEIPRQLPDDAARATIRRRWGIGEGEFVIGTLGALTPEKGLDVVIDAAALLREQLPEARFIIPADTALPGERPPSNVQIVEYVENLQEFFPALDLFAMPSRDEGLGSAALAAMSYGVPVVASRVGGLPEVVEDGVTGWLVPPGSAQELARAIVDAARDARRLLDFGYASRGRARLFNSDIMLSRAIKLYERLLRGPRNATRTLGRSP